MIKTFRHDLIHEIDKRDKDVNDFTNEHGSWAQLVNTTGTHIITTIFYGVKETYPSQTPKYNNYKK